MLIDFLIGLFAVNALPHYLFGRLGIDVLSLFGYEPWANLAYSAFCMAVALILFGYKYGFSVGALSEHMMLIGALAVVFAFYGGWDVINARLRRNPPPSDA